MTAIAERTVDLTPLCTKVLARFAAELADAGDLQFGHLARMAEGNFSTGLGQRMRDLVDDERTRRVIRPALMPLPPLDDQPQAGPRRTDGLPARVPAIYGAVERAFGGVVPDFPVGWARLGPQFFAIREQRWKAAGQVGDPLNPEFDDFFYQDGEGRG